MITTENKISKLSDIKTGDTIVITKVSGHGAFRKRITEMGFVKGKPVTVIKNQFYLSTFWHVCFDISSRGRIIETAFKAIAIFGIP